MVALLRTISYGWRQETLRENVLHIAEVGRKVHGALLSFAEQFSGIGKRLNQMTESYNKAASAFEREGCAGGSAVGRMWRAVFG